MTAKSGVEFNDAVLKSFVERLETEKTAPKKRTEAEELQIGMETREFELPEGEGWVKYTKLFGKSHTGQEHAVRQFKEEDWPEELRLHIPEVDEHYIFPKKETERFVVALMQGDKSFIHGPKGSGKSSLPTQVCALLKIPFMRVNCREDMESSAIFGNIDVQEGSMNWHAGPAEELGLHGGLLQIDEISLAPAGINMAMQWMLEENGKIFLADKPGGNDEKLVTPHEWFRVVATDNTQLQGDTTGQYGGAQVQNAAMLDRFQTTIELNYLSAAHETKILKEKVPELTPAVIRDMLKFAGLVRTAYNKQNIQFTMSPRTLINWGRKIAYWGSPVQALEMSFFDKLIPDDRKQIDEYCNKIFGEHVK